MSANSIYVQLEIFATTKVVIFHDIVARLKSNKNLEKTSRLLNFTKESSIKRKK